MIYCNQTLIMYIYMKYLLSCTYNIDSQVKKQDQTKVYQLIEKKNICTSLTEHPIRSLISFRMTRGRYCFSQRIY